ncbi:MAG: T9SS type A sorting domain-containing protein [Chitinophagales bacterium]|nr:T9SS type A sorting domain-containing protein [Chitinophagales bacterium]
MTSTLSTINADMISVDVVSGSAVPYGFGSGTPDLLYGVAFSGASNAYPVSNYSGFTIMSNINGSIPPSPLPMSGSGLSGGTANDPDIAIGSYYDNTLGTLKFFALLVYEYSGRIYLEHYDITSTTSNTLIITPSPTNNPVEISINSNAANSNNDKAGYPHIALWHAYGTPSLGGVTETIAYAVTWHHETSTPGVYEVWAYQAVIDQNGVNHPIPSTNSDFKIDDGKYPDVTAVTASNSGGSGYSNMGYVTYLANTGDDLYLGEWDYNTKSVSAAKTLNTNTTTNNDELKYPRISGPMYHDYSGTSTTDPVASVVVAESDNSSYSKINTYTYFPGLLNNIIEEVDASDFNSSNGFSSNSYEAIMPVVTGVGSAAAAYGSGYYSYPVAFYSDYNNPTYPYSYTSSGDFYAFGLDNSNSATQPILTGSNYYWEANPDELQIGSPFSMGGTRPAIAIATANNTGYGQLVAYFDGTFLRYNLLTSAYSYKPGRPESVASTLGTNIATYPNPVQNQLYVTNANGVDYIMRDMTGRDIVAGKVSGNNAVINASSLASGMYMLQLSKDGHTEQVKFVKQ